MSDLSKLVKPLVWHPEHGCSADGMGIHYSMCEMTLGLFAMTSPYHSETDLPKAEMQAAAQRDYTARIIAALDPEALAKIRADALREAAERAQNRWAIRKEHAAALYEMDYPEALIDSKTVSAKGDEAESIANEILALINKEDQA